MFVIGSWLVGLILLVFGLSWSWGSLMESMESMESMEWMGCITALDVPDAFDCVDRVDLFAECSWEVVGGTASLEWCLSLERGVHAALLWDVPAVTRATQLLR